MGSTIRPRRVRRPQFLPIGLLLALAGAGLGARAQQLPTGEEVEARLAAVDGSRPIRLNGAKVTFGFELEGKGPAVVQLIEPRDPSYRRWWRGAAVPGRYREFAPDPDTPDPNTGDYRVRTDRFPYLDEEVTREDTGNWEVRSTVFDTLDAAIARMRDLGRRAGSDARGFHLHVRLRMNRDLYREHAEEITGFIDRVANFIFLRRVEHLRSDLSLRSISNDRYAPYQLEVVHDWLRGAPTGREKLHTLGFRPEGNDLDLEIRGLWLRVDEIAWTARAIVAAFLQEDWGGRSHRDNFLRATNHMGQQPPDLVAAVEEHLRARGEPLSPERARAVRGLQFEFAEKAFPDCQKRYPANLGLPLLPWEREPYLSPETRSRIVEGRARFLDTLVALADRVLAGHFGDGGLGQRRMDYLAITREAGGAVVAWARSTQLADELGRSLLLRRLGAPTLARGRAAEAVERARARVRRVREARRPPPARGVVQRLAEVDRTTAAPRPRAGRPAPGR